MKPVALVEGRGVPLGRSDIDTDQIIPSEWLKRVERTGFGRGLFSEWRDDPSFILNQQDFVGAAVLVANARFGTGSSREHAVWALMDYGFEAVVASSFGDIFRNNASKQGLVIVELAEADVAELRDLIEKNPRMVITIDLTRRTIEVAEVAWQREFAMSDTIRERLLNGWDDIGLTLLHEDDISAFETSYDRQHPSAAAQFSAEATS
jgi:3-isopropylmalate/(R)-2-methylmalate dehydratase small subunit